MSMSAKREVRYVQALAYAWGRADTDQATYELNQGVDSVAFATWYADVYAVETPRQFYTAYQEWKRTHNLTRYPDPNATAAWNTP